jgi:glutamine amidotransferase-like uncharacterized protein
MINSSLVKLGTITAICFLLLVPANTIPFSDSLHSISGNQDDFIITVALYDTWGRNNRYIEEILNYSWTINNATYRFLVTTIDADGVYGLANVTLTNENFDVFIIGASADSYLVDGLDRSWKQKVQQFVANGGGYLGICGGANAASLGFEHPRNWFHKRVNRGVLGLANIYINDNFLNEWQYLMKIGFGRSDIDYPPDITPSYISVNTSVQKGSNNSIFKDYNDNYRYITYAGGPGMYPAEQADPRFGTVIPLLTYNEEPMTTKPIHYWIPTLTGWKIFANVTTRLYGSYAGIATTYNGNGRVVLYGPHPEDTVVVNGTILEYLGNGMLNFMFPFETYVFNYFGTSLGQTYNWWIVRRSVAWAANIPDGQLPPVE